MSTKNYPPLTAGVITNLVTIRQRAAADPSYLEDGACPYPEEIKALFAPSERPRGAVRIFEGATDDADRADLVLEEVESTIEEMKGVEFSLRSSETSEKIAFYRAKTQMIERWATLKEKLYSIKQHSEFQRLVISTMELFLDKDQQQDFKNKLKGIK